MKTSQHDLIRLRQAVRESRLGLACEFSGLVRELDFRSRFAESVKRHPLGWIGGAASAGLLAVLIGPRKRKETSSTASPGVPSGGVSSVGRPGWIAGAIQVARILYPVVKPLLAPMLTDLFGKYARSGLAKSARLQ